MLIIFHYFGIILYKILKYRKTFQQMLNLQEFQDADHEKYLKFDPPVFRQRFSKVYETLINEKWRNDLKKLVDFGCAEFDLFIYIKNLNIEQITFVDIDESLLREKLGKLEPLLADRLRRRNCPLEVFVYRGSVVDPDYRLRKTDVVTAIELIEHLYPDTLEALPYNIFSFIKPKLAIITTPNADFNVVFARKDGFRHPDHKFEWTRQQFEDWAINLTERFPDYIVEFTGVGELLSQPKNIGKCSQVAIFIRKDLLYENYISSAYAKPCQCSKSSPCKGQTTDCKLLCNCLCAFCLPDFSVGICKYLSCNIKESEAYRPMKTDPKRGFSDPDLNCKFELFLNNDPNDADIDLINPLYSIYYKLIMKIDYPYEVDTRSEIERLMETFKYRIRTFSNADNRFYNEDRQQCEIPLWDILYGDIHVTEEEVRHLLSKEGYQIEKCLNQTTGEFEYCIITLPLEMEDITSSSEVTEEYINSARNSECKETPNIEAQIDSDWDDIDRVEKTTTVDLGATSSVNGPMPDPLFDSGYLKSPSPLEGGLQLLQDNLVAEIDQFEEARPTPNLGSDDNKLHLKKSVANEKFVAPPPSASPNYRKAKLDPNRVNELDRFHNMTTVKTFNLKPQEEYKRQFFKDYPYSVAGSSSSWKKPKKLKEKDKNVIEKKEFKEPTILDDAKSLTNCIIQNSLNKIDVRPEIVGPHSVLIRDLSPLRDPPEIMDLHQQIAIPAIQQIPEEPIIQAVENGDLANNNRDNEGNNLLEQEQLDVDEGIDLLNDNLEEIAPLLEDNMDMRQNNNELIVEVAQEQEEVIEELAIANNIAENNEEPIIELKNSASIAQASREVLFDDNSQQDLLEDFDIPPMPNRDDSVDVYNIGNSVLLMGVHPVSSVATRTDPPDADSTSIQTSQNGFPNWLLQILGTQAMPEEFSARTRPGNAPHFYCQGDGLGVHPSVIAVEVDEAEDADNDTTSDDSSSNNTADFAEVDPGPSDIFDMSSLPEESSLAVSIIDDNGSRGPGSSDDNNQGSHEDNEIIEAGARGLALVDDIINTAEEEVSLRSETIFDSCSSSIKKSRDNFDSAISESSPSITDSPTPSNSLLQDEAGASCSWDKVKVNKDDESNIPKKDPD